MLYDILHPRDWRYGLRDSAKIAKNLTQDEVVQKRMLSGDLVCFAGTTKIVPETWWLFCWEQNNKQAYAVQAINHFLK